MPSPKQAATENQPVIIKKYANRRLYDTESSSYITLDHLAAMTRAGRDFKVVDAKSGDDITHNVLTQIIVEEEGRGTTLLPVSFLRQIISMYGDQMQSMVPQYLEASMDAFRRNQEQARSAMVGMMAGGTNPFEALAMQNMAMMQAAAEMWAPVTSKTSAAAPAANASKHADSEEPASKEDLKSLKAELMALQSKIEKLAGD